MASEHAHGLAGDAVVEKAARANALDRYLAARLAPKGVRRDLIALAAFLGEVSRVVGTVSEPMIGEMRLQWWRDALDPGRTGGSTGSPIAEALRDTITRHALPEELFSTILEAHSRALDPQFSASGPALDRYLDATEGAAFRLAAIILDSGKSAAAGDLLFAAGQAYGRVHLLRTLPLSLAAGRSSPLSSPLSGPAHAPVAPDWGAIARPMLDAAKSQLDEARLRAPAAPATILPAILPLALVEPYLAALERLGPSFARERADISPLTRVWRLWWASARGRI
jgi:phytoene synthase